MEFKKKINMGKKRERQTKKQTLNYRELMVTKGEVGREWVKQEIGIRKCTCYDELWVLYESTESLNCTPETTITPYVN